MPFYPTIRATILASIAFALVAGCERAGSPPAVGDTVAEQDAPVRSLVEEPPLGLEFAQDQDERLEVLQFIEAHCANAPRLKIYCSSGSNSTHVDIYGVTELTQQEEIVEFVRAEIPNRKWKQVYFIFRDREHFVAQKDGWEKREGERVLYSAIVKRP